MTVSSVQSGSAKGAVSDDAEETGSKTGHFEHSQDYTGGDSNSLAYVNN